MMKEEPWPEEKEGVDVQWGLGEFYYFNFDGFIIFQPFALFGGNPEMKGEKL